MSYNISGDQCAILKNTKELRDKLKKLGYKKILTTFDDDEYTAMCTIPLRGLYMLSNGNADSFSPMTLCNNEDEFLARATMYNSSNSGVYFISEYYPFSVYEDIPKDKLKHYRRADEFELKAILGKENMSKFKIGKYSGEYVCKIIYKDFNYVTWCIDNMKGFKLLNIEKRYYEYIKEIYEINKLIARTKL